MANLHDEMKQTLSVMASFTGGDQTVEASDGARRIACRLVTLDSLACAFTRLAVTSDALKGLSIAGLKDVADRLASRLTYLLEPISPIEIDSQGCAVQLRSNPPQKVDTGTTYYELLVGHVGEISLVRYNRPPGAPRGPIAAQVTREVLLRLVADFAGVS